MDVVVAIAIAILGIIFIGSLVALILVCRHRYCRKFDFSRMKEDMSRPNVTLVRASEPGSTLEDLGVELCDVNFTNPTLEEILLDEDWIDDATGLMPHCIEILKTCKHLTEKLVAVTMGNSTNLKTPDYLQDVIVVAKRINPRVDDVVRCLYPPLDPKLLEARFTALTLSVGHLALVTKNACISPESMVWIDDSLSKMEEHLQVLREAAIADENTDSRSYSLSSTNSHQAMIDRTDKPDELITSNA
ncbi:transmembrane protein 98-like [Ptychodera flava]|uniref:transmembrane protein 98-like n=1 Tax=Ptychodera flava TaxID=63121 RepID=UPI00396A76ED